MNQDAANRVRSEAARLIPSTVYALGDADRFCGGAITCQLEMAGQNVRFADPVIREEAVGGLGIRPILADERNALSHGASNLREQFAELSPSRSSLNSHPLLSRSIQHSPSKDRKRPFADRSLNVSPIEHPLANQVLSKESQVILSIQDFADQRIIPSSQSYG
ncbi:hypothetical protein AB7M16_005040 [Bradyrhizobium sp. USDA 372]